MLSLHTGSTLPPKHPTKPKRTFLWTTGTTLLSVITVQELMHCLGLGLMHQLERQGPFSQLSLTPLICIPGAGIYSTFPGVEGSWRVIRQGLSFPSQQPQSRGPRRHPAPVPPTQRGGGATCQAQTSSPSAHRGRPPFDFVLFNLREPGL